MIHSQRCLDKFPQDGLEIVQVKTSTRKGSQRVVSARLAVTLHSHTIVPSLSLFLLTFLPFLRCFTASVNSPTCSPTKPLLFFTKPLYGHLSSPFPPLPLFLGFLIALPPALTPNPTSPSCKEGASTKHRARLLPSLPRPLIHAETLACSRLAAQAVIDG